MKARFGTFTVKRTPIAAILECPDLLPLVSDYWLCVAIGQHLSHCFSEVTIRQGFLGRVVLSTRIKLAPEIFLLIDSLPDGSEMKISAEYLLGK